MDTLTGKLLIASPRLDDPNFGQSVVLVVHHEREGAFGLVLNRPGNDRLASVWTQVVEEPCPLDVPILVGGPLEGPLMALHGEPDRSEIEVVPGVHFARRKEALVDLVSGAKEPLRVFVGYSGWSRGQLEGEIERGDWTLTDATPALVFGEEGSMWRRARRHAADEAIVSALHIKHVPERPWHN